MRTVEWACVCTHTRGDDARVIEFKRKKVCAACVCLRTENLDDEGGVDRSVGIDGFARVDAGVVGAHPRHLQLPPADAPLVANLLAVLQKKAMGKSCT